MKLSKHQRRGLPRTEIGGITHYKDALGWFSTAPDAKRIPYAILYPMGGVGALSKLKSKYIIDHNKVYFYKGLWQAVFIMNGVHFLYPIEEVT